MSMKTFLIIGINSDYLEHLFQFLDIFYFPAPKMAFSLYFGAIPIDSEFAAVELDRCYLAYVTWLDQIMNL